MKNTNNVPRLRFPKFTDDWEQRKAKELCNIGTGKSNTQDQVKDGIYPFYIRSGIPVKSNKYLYDCEAVITIGDGNIGRVFHYVNGKFDLHQRCYKMTDFQDIWGKYFYYFFSTRFYDRTIKMTAKATVDSVRLEMISEMDIWKPIQIDEQKKIAAFFTNLDNLITLHQRKCKKLEEYKKAMLQKIFSQEVRFKREDGTEYPEWKKKTISELFEISAGGDIDKANSTKEYSKDYPYAVYANALTNKGLYGYANYYKVERDCFTVTGRGDVGYAVARHEKFVPIVRLLVCIPKHNENVDFFAEIVNYTNILIESTGVPQLTSIQLGKIKVNYPTDIEEQQKIADFLSAYDEAISYAKQELEHWKKLKKGLLQQMFV